MCKFINRIKRKNAYKLYEPKQEEKMRQLTEIISWLHSQQKRICKTLNFRTQKTPLEITKPNKETAVISDSVCSPETERPKQKAEN